MREGNLGRYLLSGAAAVLVLSAGVSLLALVWDSIPDLVKILALALIAVTMTAAGTHLSMRRPRYRVAAATVTGTGGGLGFVSVIGSVLLGGILSPESAVALMACWGLVLLLVSHLTRLLFTAVVSAIGALVIIGFTVGHVGRQPQTAIVSWLMIGIYVTVLALTCAMLSRHTARMRLAAWYPATSMAATVGALLLAPISPMLRVSVTGGTGVVLGLCLLLICQVMHASRRLWSIGVRATGWDWGAAAAVLLVAYTRLLISQTVLEVERSFVVVTFLLQLLQLAAAALWMLAPHSPVQWRRAAAIGHETAVIPLALTGVLVIEEPRVYLFVVLACALCLLPAIIDGRIEPPVILALLGTAPLLTANLVSYTRVESLSLVTSILLSTLLVVIAEGLGRRALPTGPEQRGQVPVAHASSRPLSLRLALIVVAVNLAVVAPAMGAGAVDGSENVRSVLFALPGLISITLVLMGAVSDGATPLRVFSGQCRAARYRVGPNGAALPDPRNPLRGAPAPSWIVMVLLTATGTLTLSWAHEVSSQAWTGLLVAVALSTGAVATWILLPWARRGEVCLSLAVGDSLLLCLSIMAVTDVGPGSVLMSVTVLATGGACIVLGFRRRLTVLRHYGLTLVLLAVLKLAVIDLASQNSIIRVISTAAAGVVCFVLSLLYNRYAAEQRRQPHQGYQDQRSRQWHG